MDGRIHAVGDQRLAVALGHLTHGEVRLEGDAVADARDAARPIAAEHGHHGVECEVAEDGAAEHGHLVRVRVRLRVRVRVRVRARDRLRLRVRVRVRLRLRLRVRVRVRVGVGVRVSP